MGMRNLRSFSPPFAWWLRSGERLSLGMDIRRVLDAGGAGVSRKDAIGLFLCREWIEEGCGLVESLRRAGLKIPEEAWCLLESGERTGRLGEAMAEVGDFLKDAGQRQREFYGQIWYPCIVVLTGCMVMAIILIWVVPQMRQISISMGQGGQVPWLTEHIGVLYGLFFLGSAGTGLVTFLFWVTSGYCARRSFKCASMREKIANFVPFFGSLRRERRESRILRQLGTLLHGAITLPAALDLAATRSPDQWEVFQLEEFRKRVLMGISFEESLQAFAVIDKLNRPLVMIGQESGQMDAYLLRIATELDREISWKLKQAMRILEPAIIFGLAILIAGLVLAYLLPTISLMEHLA